MLPLQTIEAFVGQVPDVVTLPIAWHSPLENTRVKSGTVPLATFTDAFPPSGRMTPVRKCTSRETKHGVSWAKVTWKALALSVMVGQAPKLPKRATANAIGTRARGVATTRAKEAEPTVCVG